MSPPTISVVGTGPVARVLAHAYAEAGGEVVAMVSRDGARGGRAADACGAGRGSDRLADALEAAVVIVAVPDRAIAEVGERLMAAAGADVVVFHTSGALPGNALGDGPLRSGSLHPLQSFPQHCEDEGGVARLAARVPGTHWFHDGSGLDEARALVEVWKGTLHELNAGSKALYHAGAAVLSQGDVDALLDQRPDNPNGGGKSSQSDIDALFD